MHSITRETRFPVLDAIGAWVTRAYAASDTALARPATWWTAALAVFVLQAVLILTHRPWADEYQAVQIAVMAPDIATMLDWLRYEGHPPLWYLLLRGLAYLVEPNDTLWLAALLIALPTQFLILFKSPFGRSERLLIVLSEFVLFDALTISRSLTLGVALMVLAMVLWRKRWVWLAIAILPMCDFLFGVVSGVFVLLIWYEKRLYWPGIGLWLAFSALAGWAVIPAPDMVNAFDYIGADDNPWLWFQKLSGLAVPFQGGALPGWNRPLYPLADMAWIGFLALAWFATAQDRFQRLMLFGFIGFTFAFSLAVYPIGLRHMMLIALLLILLVWRQRAEGVAAGPDFRLWLGICAACGVATAGIALSRPFDTAHLALTEIERQGLQDKHWAMFPDWRVPALTAQSSLEFERLEQQCMLTFQVWNYRPALFDPERLAGALRDAVKKRGRFYLASDVEITALPKDLARQIAVIEEGYDMVPYYLYVVGPDADERPVSLPRCVPDQRPFAKLGK